MKRKIVAVLMMIVLGSSLVACTNSNSSSNGGNETSLSDSSSSEVTTEVESEVSDVEVESEMSSDEQSQNGGASQIVIHDNKSDSEESMSGVSDEDFKVKEYKYAVPSWGYTLYYLVITNKSNEVVSISANGTAKDKNGNSISADNAGINVLGPDETSITYFYFDTDKKIKKVDYTLNYTVDPYYDPVISNLAIEETINDDNVIVSLTNNGDYPAEFVEAYALFFDKEGNVVETDSRYFTDDDNEIKVGATISEQLSSYEDFDNVEVYFTGRYRD